MNNRNMIYTILAVIVILLGAALYEFSRPITFFGSHIQPAKAMPDFTLTSAQGPVTLSSFRGKYVVLFFGFISCPDVCPTTSAALRAALDQLNGQDSQVQVIFISVDHKRDTPGKVFNYVKTFSPNFVGLVGNEAETNKVTKDFGIFYELGTPDPATGAYLVDHTASMLVLDRQGGLVLTWSYDQQPNEMASDLKILLSK